MFLGSPGAARHVRYEGALNLEEHSSRQVGARQYHSIRELWTDGRNRARLEWTTWVDGDSIAEPEIFLKIQDDIYHRDTPAAKWRYLRGARRERARLQFLSAAPWLIEGRGPLPEGVVRVAHPDRRTSYVRPRSHSQLGDVRDSIGFEYSPADEPIPTRVKFIAYESDSRWTLIEELTWRDGSKPADSLLAAPSWFEPEYDEPAPYPGGR
ncbi:MAG TPA: hypothetical protein VJW75_03870 [Candidatus Eisenbacteria bacterium]|nr:hypothetical protein [Candidatus Eisenbacteria bacterium]